jgi:hypothetical protein
MTDPGLGYQDFLVYGDRWNNMLQFMIGTITPDEARRRFASGDPFMVAVGRGLATDPDQAEALLAAGHSPVTPETTLVIVTGTGVFSTRFHGDYGSIDVIYHFRAVDPQRLFLKEVVFYTYPDQPRLFGQDENTSLTWISFTTEGISHQETTRADSDLIDVVDRHSVRLDERHWEPYPEFGDWASLARPDRRPDANTPANLPVNP